MKKIALYTETYNQEREIESFSKKTVFLLKKLLQGDLISDDSLVYFVDNCSKDNTWYEISKEKVRNPNFINAIKLSTRTKTKAINTYLSQKTFLAIKIDTNFDENKIIKIIQENKQGFFNLSKKQFNLKELFLSNKINIKEEI